MPKRLSRRALSALAVSTSVLLCGALVSSTTASAAVTATGTPVATRPAPLPGRPVQTARVMKLHLNLTPRASLIHPNDVGSINCTLSVQYPHSSSHVAGTVNDISNVSCNAPVAGLAMTLALYYWNGSAWGLESSSTNGNVGQASLTTQTAAPCVSGIWEGLANAAGAAPPGYYPPTATATSASPPVSISC